MTQERRGRAIAIHLGALGDLVLALPALERLASVAPLELWGPGERVTLPLAPRGPARSARDLPPGLFADAGDPAGASVDAELARATTVAFTSGEGVLPSRVLGARGVVLPPFPPGAREQEGEAIHVADFLLRELERHAEELGLPERARSRAVPRLEATGADRVAGAARLAPLTADASYVTVAPGSGGRGKRWPAAHFAAVAGALREGGRSVVVLLGPAELDPPDPALRLTGTGSHVIEAASLSALCGILAGARAHLGNDSGVSHLAAALGTRTVTLFGPTDPRRWGPRGAGNVEILEAPGGRLSELSPESVLGKLL